MAKDIVFFCCTHKGRFFTDYEYFILRQAGKSVRFSFCPKIFHQMIGIFNLYTVEVSNGKNFSQKSAKTHLVKTCNK